MSGIHPLLKAVQIDLFHPPRQTPDWWTLPRATREQTVVLLAHLLRAHLRPCPPAKPTEERNDE